VFTGVLRVLLERWAKKEEAEDMTYALERAIDEIERRGIRKGKLETAKAMIANGLSWETAAKYSGIPVDNSYPALC
jgi:ornithine carbamoyltransferase